MEKVQVKLPGTNYFDLSHDHMTTGKMGDLIPISCIECIPGDRHKIRTEGLVRLAPMTAPPYGTVNIKTESFFVPWRLLWPNFEKYYRNDEVVKPAPPFIKFQSGSVQPDSDENKLARYLGVPPSSTMGLPDLEVCAGPFAAYQLCRNEFYRDQNLQTPINFELVDGDNSANADLYFLGRRAWGRDYFTSGLPFAQKGPQVTIPVGNFQDVPVKVNDNGGTTLDGTPLDVPVDGEEVDEPLIPEDTLYAETSLLDAEATSINTWRKLIKLQEYYERLGRVGSRFIEVLKGFFGVSPTDARLQRPEYVCGSRSSVRISEVLNTTGTPEAPQGNMAGHGIGRVETEAEYYSVQEPGFLITIASVLPDTVYFQGLPRHLVRKGDVLDSFYFPQFAHLGEQPVYNQEVFAWTADADDRLETFNYQPIYAHHRFINSRISGNFQGNLLYWTFAREFADLPGFNADFIEAQPTDRVFAVQDGTDYLWMHWRLHIDSQRPMPIFGTPSI